MTNIDYRERLNSFNSTQKYKLEVEFMARMICPRKGERILDYGCGNGTCLKFLSSNSDADLFGYDILEYFSGTKPLWFLNEIRGCFDKIYFMHSIAHIPNIVDILCTLKNNLLKNGRIYVLTPNRLFDEYFKIMTPDKDYLPDCTVQKHFSSIELENLFITSEYTIVNQGQIGKIKNDQHERLFLECIEK